MTDSQLAAFIQAHPGWGRIRLAKATGAPPRAIRRILGQSRPTATKTPAKGIGVSAMLGRLDYSGQIAKAVARHLGRQFLLEQDFRILSGVPAIPFRRIADAGEFDDNRWKHDGKVYWSTAANVELARKEQEKYR
jgi:hypothetical protein